MLDDTRLLDDVRSVLHELGLVGFVSWEELLEVPGESYIISFDDTSFFSNSELMKCFSELVLVAKNRAVVKLSAGMAYADMEHKIKEYNSFNVMRKLRRIHDSNRKQLWCEVAQPSPASEAHRARGIPHPSPSDSILRMDVDLAALSESAKTFVSAAQAHPGGKG